jgi:hypothetical protein
MKPIFSKIAIILVACSMVYFTGTEQRYRKTVIEWDIVSYYAYLPGLVIHEDLSFSFLDKKIPIGSTIWTERTPDNRRVLKMTCGLSILYAPFFFIAHGIALLQPDMYEPNGYSMIYSLFLILSDIFYTLVGLWVLSNILLRYFSDAIAALTILSVYFSTNMLYYSLFEVMSHNYSFCLVTIFIFLIIKWHEKITFANSILIGLVFGLITLIRPVDCLVFIIFLFYGISEKKEFLGKLRLFWSHRVQLLIIIICATLIFSIQMAYWKYATGHYLFWSYTTERFYLTHPEIIKGLFGFRKGWFIYSPIMFFATIGLLFTVKYARQFTLGFIFLIIAFSYITFTWWCWWYGGGLSCRPMIDIYGVFAIGLASFFATVFQLRNLFIKCCIGIVLCFCFIYGTMTNKQYYLGALHYDSMTFESWKKNFMTTEVREDYYDALRSPAYDKACKCGTEEE